MGIGKDFARANIMNQYIGIEPFWDKQNGLPGYYSDLNKVTIPSEQEIRTKQLESIKEVEDKVLEQKYKQLNNSLFSPLNKMLNLYETEENQILSTAIEKLSQTANSIYTFQRWGGINETNASRKRWKDLQGRLSRFNVALKNLIQVTQANNNVVLDEQLETVNQALEEVAAQTVSGKNIKTILTTINQIKGEVLEEAGVEWLNNIGMPDVTTIRVGNVGVQTEQSNRHKGQLIQDLLTIDTSIPNILNTPIEYRKAGSKELCSMTLEQFINHMTSVSGKNKSIQLTDHGYDTLLELPQISVQAKAGLKQSLWNQSKYNQVHIGDFSEVDGLMISVKRTFMLLHSLDQEPPKDTWVNDSSSNHDYDALANYGLGTIAAKVLHLDAKEGNQFVLTPSGFTPFSTRMRKLMEENKLIMHLRQKVTINEDTLGTAYDVALNGNY